MQTQSRHQITPPRDSHFRNLLAWRLSSVFLLSSIPPLSLPGNDLERRQPRTATREILARKQHQSTHTGQHSMAKETSENAPKRSSAGRETRAQSWEVEAEEPSRPSKQVSRLTWSLTLKSRLSLRVHPPPQAWHQTHNQLPAGTPSTYAGCEHSFLQQSLQCSRCHSKSLPGTVQLVRQRGGWTVSEGAPHVRAFARTTFGKHP